MSNHFGVKLIQSAGGISGIADYRISLDKAQKLVFILETNMETYFDTRGRSIISKIVASNGRASFQQTANRGWPALSTDDG